MNDARVRAVVDRTLLFEEIASCVDLHVAVRDAAASVLRLLPAEIAPVFHRDGCDAELLFEADRQLLVTVSVHDDGHGEATISIYTHALHHELAAQIVTHLHRFRPGS